MLNKFNSFMEKWMKGTDHFKRTIYMYLEQRAEEDALFAKKYRNQIGRASCRERV